MAMLEDGYSTLISICGATLFEVSVTPPGVDGGDAIDVTTMRNTLWKTFSPQSLQTLTPCSFVAAYDPISIVNAATIDLNVNQQIVVTFSDASTVTFWGYMRTFIPNECAIGERPTANCEIVPTNRDNNGNEVNPTHA